MEDQLGQSCEKMEELQCNKRESNILNTIKMRMSNWICHICIGFHLQNPLMKEIQKGSRGRRRKQLLDALKGKDRIL